MRDRLALTGVNSINFARILAQIALLLHRRRQRSAPLTAPSPSPCRPEISVIFSLVTRRGRWACRSRASLLPRTSTTVLPAPSATGIYEPKGVIATSSPSMDIQLASNFERLLFELAGRDAARVRSLMDELAQDWGVPSGGRRACEMRALFAAHSIGEHETEMTIRGLVRRPACSSIRTPPSASPPRAQESGLGATPMIVLSTAHPAKFPEAVERATRPRARAARALAAQARPAGALHRAAQRLCGGRRLHRQPCPRGRQARKARERRAEVGA